MERPIEQPHVSPNLALELLRTPPAPIPKSDPLLCGRSCLLDSTRSGAEDGPLANTSGSPVPRTCGAGAGPKSPPPCVLAAEQTSLLQQEPDTGDAASGSRPDNGCAGGYRQLPSHAATDLSYDDFVRHYMSPNRPVVIRGVTSDWRASAEWRTADGRLRLGPLGQLAGHCRVCVTDTSDQDDGCGEVRTMSLSEYLAWWARRAAAADTTHATHKLQLQPNQQQQPEPVSGCGSGAAQAAVPAGACRSSQAGAAAVGTGFSVSERACGNGTGINSGGSNDDGSGSGREGLMYLKDWHFVAEFPNYGAYRLPVYFADDWLNTYYDHLAGKAAAADKAAAEEEGCTRKWRRGRSAQISDPPSAAFDGGGGSRCSSAGGSPPPAFTSDYRFCYLGPAGTWTPLHSDVLRSHSWSANVAGCKRWLMLEPGYTHLLYDRQMLRLAPHLELDRVHSGCDPRDFPGLEEARRLAFEFVQEAGDAVFVPSGWHHCVENMADTLSLNHNWINGHNAHWTWALLRRQYTDAAAAIDDCRQLCPPDEFEELVQSNLAANSGLNWNGFVGLLDCTARRVLEPLRSAARRPGTAPMEGMEAAVAPAVGKDCPWCLAEAERAGAEVMHALLTLQRAGRLLREYVAAFEELVLAPRAAAGGRAGPARPQGGGGGGALGPGAEAGEAANGGDNEGEGRALDRLRLTPSYLAALALAEDVEAELHSRGFYLAPVG